MKFSKGIVLHQEVIHVGKWHKGKCEGANREFPLKDSRGKYDKTCEVCQEERFIKKLAYKTLQSVCSDCFGIREQPPVLL